MLQNFVWDQNHRRSLNEWDPTAQLTSLGPLQKTYCLVGWHRSNGSIFNCCWAVKRHTVHQSESSCTGWNPADVFFKNLHEKRSTSSKHFTEVGWELWCTLTENEEPRKHCTALFYSLTLAFFICDLLMKWAFSKRKNRYVFSDPKPPTSIIYSFNIRISALHASPTYHSLCEGEGKTFFFGCTKTGFKLSDLENL